MGSDALASLVKKFNKKMIVFAPIQDHEEPTFAFDEIENETDAIKVDIAEAIGKAHDDWLDADNLEDMFAEQIRMDHE